MLKVYVNKIPLSAWELAMQSVKRRSWGTRTIQSFSSQNLDIDFSTNLLDQDEIGTSLVEGEVLEL